MHLFIAFALAAGAAHPGWVDNPQSHAACAKAKCAEGSSERDEQAAWAQAVLTIVKEAGAPTKEGKAALGDLLECAGTARFAADEEKKGDATSEELAWREEPGSVFFESNLFLRDDAGTNTIKTTCVSHRARTAAGLMALFPVVARYEYPDGALALLVAYAEPPNWTRNGGQGTPECGSACGVAWAPRSEAQAFVHALARAGAATLHGTSMDAVEMNGVTCEARELRRGPEMEAPLAKAARTFTVKATKKALLIKLTIEEPGEIAKVTCSSTEVTSLRALLERFAPAARYTDPAGGVWVLVRAPAPAAAQ